MDIYNNNQQDLPETKKLESDQKDHQAKNNFLKPLIIVVGIAIFFGSVYGAYYFGQQKETISPTPTSIPTISQITPTVPVTLGNYVNEQMGISLNIPQSWEDKYRADFSIDTKLKDNKTLIFTYLGETKEYGLFGIYSTTLANWENLQSGPGPSTIKKLGTKGDIVYYSSHSLDNPFTNADADTYQSMSTDIDQILSTFKFTDQVNSPSLTPITQNYPRPANWKTLNLSSIGISVCTPQDWQTENGSTIVYNRDPGYKPDVATVRVLDYKGGSKREEYINERLQYEEFATKLKSETKVEELTVGDKEILYITIPSFPDAVVFVLGNKLYAFELSSWNLINDSQSAFLKDIYTMINCVKKI